MPEADTAHRAALLIIAGEGAVLIARAQRSTEPPLLVAEAEKVNRRPGLSVGAPAQRGG